LQRNLIIYDVSVNLAITGEIMVKYIFITFLLFGCSQPQQPKTPLKPSKKSAEFTPKENNALNHFFRGQKLLTGLNIIKSKNYHQDIAEFMSVKIFGHGNNRKVYFHNCPKDTPLNIKGEINFSHIVVVLGPNSNLRKNGIRNDFLLFRFTMDYINTNFSRDGSNRSCGKSCFTGIPHGIIPFNLSEPKNN
jgi:hypothetical protein